MYTDEQKAWLKRYEDVTGIPAMMDNFEAGQTTFYQDARFSVQWYRDHAEENARRVEVNIPGADESKGPASNFASDPMVIEIAERHEKEKWL